tara:strand:- start:4086 stop:5762 length:1677 start_codon:yes stop_codon:yes gene_type:complete
MCGFIISNKKIDLKKNSKLLNHRGPDDIGILKSNKTKFIFNRLKIVDLKKRSNQPIRYKNLIMVFNGEIYNYLSLKDKIKKKGLSFETSSDTEVLLKCFYLFGKKTLKMIQGMFVFAIYDEKKQKLFIARDHFGIKPLFYHYDKGKYLISSEKHVFFKNNIKKEIDLKSISNYLQYGDYQSSGDTFFKNIKSLLPGHYMEIKNNKMKIYRWYKINSIKNISTFKNAKFKLKKILAETLNLNLSGDKKIALSCSGGVDSSVLAELSKKLNDKNLKYILHYTCNDENDETKFARNINKDLNYKFYKSIFKKKDFYKYLIKSMMIVQEPVGGLNNLNALKAYEFLKKKKIRVLIDGNGSDEILGGYQHYINSFNDKKKFTVPPTQGLEVEFPKTIFKKELLQHKKKLKLGNTPRHLMKYDLFGRKVRSQLLQGDHLSMRNSIEVRFPFLDYKLVNYCMGLPYKFLFKDKIGKYILRQLLKNKKVNTPKRVLQTPQNKWMKEFIIKDLSKLINNKKSEIYKYKIFKRKNLIKFFNNIEITDNSILEWRLLIIFYFFKLLPNF